MRFSPLTPLLTLIPHIHAWGTLGHQTVAIIAQNFVQPETQTFFQLILSNPNTTYLADIATWADTIRYTSWGAWTAPLHFIDVEDTPPTKCEVKFDRDCGPHSCIVGAIGNYTNQIQDTSLNPWLRNQAARFLGDIHQPLHAENLARGGNSINVTWEGASLDSRHKAINLHHVWDTAIPEKLLGGTSFEHSELWAATLSERIRSGEYKSEASSWVSGMDLSDPVGTALRWAVETNALVCTNVLPQGRKGVEGKELAGGYYERNKVVVEEQVARGGYRLAKWLDLMAGTAKLEL
ncbi:phospholipase C/P1 nuclease domain-containing protein [Tricladium varicosporioides]|nr:phospholipase C/P1 nuclease domain-containing protein [Hymenoscyphus varicosporioides]